MSYAEHRADAIEVERSRRMAECWRGAKLSDAQVDDGYRRFARRRSARVAARRFSIGRSVQLVAVALLAGAGALAAEWRSHSPLPRLAPSAGAPSARENAARESRSELTSPPNSSATAGLAASVAPPRPTAPRPAAAKRARSSAERTPALAASADARPELWRRAAAALERRDFAEAERSFIALTRESDSRTRDAARLARAELWLASNRAELARPTLAELARDGSSDVIRKRAEELLRKQRAR